MYLWSSFKAIDLARLALLINPFCNVQNRVKESKPKEEKLRKLESGSKPTLENSEFTVNGGKYVTT